MKKISNVLLLIITGAILGSALLLATRLGTSQAPVDERALSAANRLFEAGRYAKSARILEQILAQGAEDSAVYYNLGNAYFAQGELPRALEYFEQAAKLAPRDKGIQHNLELTRAQVPPVVTESPGIFANLARLTSFWITINELAVILLGLWFVTCYLIFASRQINIAAARSALRFAAIAGVLFVLFMGASLGSKVYLERTSVDSVEVPTVVAQIGS